jgi:glycosyltransferase involved in cell wall biosynthesis
MTDVRQHADVTVGIPTFNRAHLLHRAIESVLAQTYPHFTLIVSDNASEDETAEVVHSFVDERVRYRPLDRNIGRVANTNRVIDLAPSEFIVLLGDDDQLCPDHLSRTVEVLKRRPAVGFVHTGFSVVDGSDRTLSVVRLPGHGSNRVAIESGARFLERSMISSSNVCFSSTVFRKAALVSGGGLRADDGIVDDFPLLLRIAAGWDRAYIGTPLAVMRAHDDASSSSLGSFTPRGFRTTRSVPEILYQHRLKFLAEAQIPVAERRRLAKLAERGHRRDVLSHLAMCANTGDDLPTTFRALRREVRRQPRLALDPWTLRFVGGRLGGRRVRDEVRRALTSPWSPLKLPS